ncbi:unnamed protein product, partial [Mesorhabditis spiculigera]
MGAQHPMPSRHTPEKLAPESWRSASKDPSSPRCTFKISRTAVAASIKSSPNQATTECVKFNEEHIYDSPFHVQIAPASAMKQTKGHHLEEASSSSSGLTGEASRVQYHGPGLDKFTVGKHSSFNDLLPPNYWWSPSPHRKDSVKKSSSNAWVPVILS